MKLFFLSWGGIAFFKFLINFSAWRKCKSYFRSYKEYIENPKWDFYGQRSEIERLFKEAGLEGGTLPFAQPVGLGYAVTGHLSVVKNMFSTIDEDIPKHIFSLFHQALGIYWRRTWEIFSPLYWIRLVIYFPREALIYLGVSPDNLVAKILQLIYWLGSVVVGIVFKAQIEVVLKTWFPNLFS